jgi:hypothetical protein
MSGVSVEAAVGAKVDGLLPVGIGLPAGGVLLVVAVVLPVVGVVGLTGRHADVAMADDEVSVAVPATGGPVPSSTS